MIGSNTLKAHLDVCHRHLTELALHALAQVLALSDSVHALPVLGRQGCSQTLHQGAVRLLVEQLPTGGAILLEGSACIAQANVCAHLRHEADDQNPYEAAACWQGIS